VRRLVGGEEHDRADDVGRLGNPAERDQRRPHLRVLGVVGEVALGVRRAGRNAVDADPARAELGGELDRQRVDPPLLDA
jgi:hypothetical protein